MGRRGQEAGEEERAGLEPRVWAPRGRGGQGEERAVLSLKLGPHWLPPAPESAQEPASGHHLSELWGRQPQDQRSGSRRLVNLGGVTRRQQILPALSPPQAQDESEGHPGTGTWKGTGAWGGGGMEWWGHGVGPAGWGHGVGGYRVGAWGEAWTSSAGGQGVGDWGLWGGGPRAVA